jgi:hypothetical protein
MQSAEESKYDPEIRDDSTLVGAPLWSSGQSSWLQIQRSGFDFRSYQIF